MRRRWGIVALTVVVMAWSTVALAGGRGRAGVVMSADGPLYDTRSPEWKASGGNIFVYQQIMEAKLERQQYQMMLKQQQMLQKAAKNAKSAAGKGKSLQDSSTTPLPVFGDIPTKKKRRTYVPTGTATSPAKAATSTPSAVTPRDTMDDPLKTPSAAPETKKSATPPVPKATSGP